MSIDQPNEGEDIVLRTRTITPPRRNQHDVTSTRPVIADLPEDPGEPSLGVVMPKGDDMELAHPQSQLGPGWQVIGLPSKGKAGYPGALHIRRFGLPDQARLTAARNSKSVELLVVAIGATIDVDPKKLTVSDFEHVMYWHRQFSFPANLPYKITWRSRYGKQNVTDMSKTKLTITDIDENPDYDTETFKALYDMGFDFPRVGAMVWEDNHPDLTEEQRAIFEQASNFAGAADRFSIEARMAAINPEKSEPDPELFTIYYSNIGEWLAMSRHGVQETISLRCSQFDPATALDDLAATLHRAGADLELTAYDDETSTFLRGVIEEMAAIRTAVSEEKEVVAVEERITVPIDIHMFFPRIDRVAAPKNGT
jgi:hypothetical protein